MSLDRCKEEHWRVRFVVQVLYSTMFFREREAVIQSTLEAQKNAHTDRRAMPTPYELSSATRTSIAEEFAKLFLKAKDDEPFADVNYSDLAEDVAEEIGFVDRKQVHEVLMLAPDFDNNGRLSGVVVSTLLEVMEGTLALCNFVNIRLNLLVVILVILNWKIELRLTLHLRLI